MAYFEAQNLPKCDKKPVVYFRYFLDIFLIWPHPQDTFDTFFDTLNNATANIKLRSNIQETALEFLDVLLCKGENFE